MILLIAGASPVYMTLGYWLHTVDYRIRLAEETRKEMELEDTRYFSTAKIVQRAQKNTVAFPIWIVAWPLLLVWWFLENMYDLCHKRHKAHIAVVADEVIPRVKAEMDVSRMLKAKND